MATPPRSPWSLADLDARLDHPVETFAARALDLARSLRRRRVGLEIPATHAVGRVRQVHSTRQYEAELARLPQMDRAAEFQTARRHEFLGIRARDALRYAGFAEADREVWLGRPVGELPEAPKPDRDAVAREALGDLERHRNLYVEGALYLVLRTAYRYRSLGVDLVDLIQEGNASLFQAIDGFDWRRDVRFQTYAQFWVHQAVLKALYDSSRTVRIPVWVQKALRKAQRIEEASEAPMTEAEVAAQLGMPAERLAELKVLRRGQVSLDAPAAGDESSTLSMQLADPREPEVVAPDGPDLGERLAEVLDDLPTREHHILTRRYGLSGAEPETLGEIAADLGVSAERVRQLQNAALRRLQRPGPKARLVDFV